MPYELGRRARIAPLAAALVLAMAGTAGCGGSGGDSPAKKQTIDVLAPATLNAVLPGLKAAFTKANPGVTVRLDMGHSPAQVIQLKQGAPGSVFIAAGDMDMNAARSQGLLAAGKPVTFARTEMEIVVRAGNPKHIKSLGDLGRHGLTVVMPAAAMPVGGFAAQALRKAGVKVHPASMEMGSPAVVQKVASGNADAGVVFTTDVKAGGSNVTGVRIPATDQVRAGYLAAVVKKAASPAAARKFVDFLQTAQAQKTLGAQGFLPP